MEVGKVETLERKTVKTEFQWKIDINFLKKRKVGEYILSPKFSKRNGSSRSCSWQLKLYPNGNIVQNREFLSLFLYNTSSNPVTATYSFALIDTVGRYKRIKFKNTKDLSVKSAFDYSGFPRYAPKSSVFHPNNKFITDNKIIILFSVVIKEQTLEGESNVQNQIHPVKSEPLGYAEKLLTTNAFSDVTIMAEGKSFYLHKCILSTRSIVFEAMFKNHTKENHSVVTIDDTKYDVLEELFRFMYTEKVSDCVSCKIWDLYTAAEKYCIYTLRKHCEDLIVNGLSEDNAVEYLTSAIESNAKSVEKNFIKFIALHLKDFIEKPEFKKLSIQYPEVAFEITRKHFSMKN